MYDSGSLLEETLRSSYPAIFNSQSETAAKQTEQMDDRSDDKGLEVESLTLATVCGKTYAFVGAERTSTIFVFDITDPRNPTLHSHISAAGNTDMTPAVAFALDPEPRPNVNLGQIDPEMMSFDAERKLLIVSGAVSVTLPPIVLEWWFGGSRAMPFCPPQSLYSHVNTNRERSVYTKSTDYRNALLLLFLRSTRRWKKRFGKSRL